MYQGQLSFFFFIWFFEHAVFFRIDEIMSYSVLEKEMARLVAILQPHLPAMHARQPLPPEIKAVVKQRTACKNKMDSLEAKVCVPFSFCFYIHASCSLAPRACQVCLYMLVYWKKKLCHTARYFSRSKRTVLTQCVRLSEGLCFFDVLFLTNFTACVRRMLVKSCCT